MDLVLRAQMELCNKWSIWGYLLYPKFWFLVFLSISIHGYSPESPKSEARWGEPQIHKQIPKKHIYQTSNHVPLTHCIHIIELIVDLHSVFLDNTIVLWCTRMISIPNEMAQDQLCRGVGAGMSSTFKISPGETLWDASFHLLRLFL